MRKMDSHVGRIGRSSTCSQHRLRRQKGKQLGMFPMEKRPCRGNARALGEFRSSEFAHLRTRDATAHAWLTDGSPRPASQRPPSVGVAFTSASLQCESAPRVAVHRNTRTPFLRATPLVRASPAPEVVRSESRSLRLVRSVMHSAEKESIAARPSFTETP
jgi:hypothetical protein